MWVPSRGRAKEYTQLHSKIDEVLSLYPIPVLTNAVTHIYMRCVTCMTPRIHKMGMRFILPCTPSAFVGACFSCDPLGLDDDTNDDVRSLKELRGLVAITRNRQSKMIRGIPPQVLVYMR